MKIRKSSLKDLDMIMEIYEIARNFMSETGNPNQWGPNKWPPVDLVINDIKEEKSYLVCSNSDDSDDSNDDKGNKKLDLSKDNKGEIILGVFYFDYGKDIDPCYLNIEEGEWMDDSPYGVLHRIASAQIKKGILEFVIDWCFQRCNHIRIDTHEENAIMQKCLEKLGFSKRGTIYVKQDNYPRIAFEKTL
ncbi:MAG: GNAT family N-acetyltransferase [Firmicutes bacterium]|nr:GNAT family N-acetyltransferase [Bacillota bacterium]